MALCVPLPVGEGRRTGKVGGRPVVYQPKRPTLTRPFEYRIEPSLIVEPTGDRRAMSISKAYIVFGIRDSPVHNYTT